MTWTDRMISTFVDCVLVAALAFFVWDRKPFGEALVLTAKLTFAYMLGAGVGNAVLRRGR